MKIVYNPTPDIRDSINFDGDKNPYLGKTFLGVSGKSRGSQRTLYLVTYDRIVDLADPRNTWSLPTTFNDVSFVDVLVMVKS